MKNNWDGLYQYLLRLIGLLREATVNISKKTSRDFIEIYFAKKICVRKFVLRMLKHASKSIENMSNMVFLVYLVVFNNADKYFDEEDAEVKSSSNSSDIGSPLLPKKSQRQTLERVRLPIRRK